MVAKTTIANKIKFQCEKFNTILSDDFYNYLENILITTNKVGKQDIFGLCENFLIPYATYNVINDYNYFINRYYEFCKLGRGVTITKLKLKYGDNEGEVRWKAYCKKQSETNSLEYKSAKYGMTESEFTEYNLSRAVTKENLIKRHGEKLGIEKWNTYVARQSYAGCKIEYFIEKYGEIDGIKKYNDVNKQKAQSLDNFIKKYGETIGKEKWKSYIENKKKSVIAQSLFLELYKNLLDSDKNSCYFYDINNELKIINGNKSKKYDFSIISKKFIIEFNGDVYHANPIYNKADDIVKYAPKSLITASEIWKRDEQKIKFAEDAGYKVLVVWESEYKENKEKVINDLLEVINNEPIK